MRRLLLGIAACLLLAEAGRIGAGIETTRAAAADPEPAAAPVAAGAAELPCRDVTADLAPPASDLTGADIEAALAACSPADGCRLCLAAGTYRDVSVSVSQREHPAGFPRGLVIEGAGPERTILQAPVPHPELAAGAGQAAILSLRLDGLTNGLLGPIEVRGLRMDGRKQHQPASIAPLAQRGLFTYATGGQRHRAGLVVEDVEVANVAGAGVELRDVSGGELRSVRAEHCGCWQNDVSQEAFPRAPNVAGHTPCGCEGRGAGSDCSGWNGLADDADQWGRKSRGAGVLLADADAVAITGSTLRHVAGPGVETSASGTSLRESVVEHANEGFVCRGCEAAVVEDNTFRVIGRSGTFLPRGRAVFIDAGDAPGAVVRGNRIHDTASHAIHVRGGSPGRPLTIEGNVVVGACREVWQNHLSDAERRAYAAITVEGRGSGAHRDLLLRANETTANFHCEPGLRVSGWRDVVVEGGYYEGAAHFDVPKGLDIRDAFFTNHPLALAPGTEGRCAALLLYGATLDDRSGDVDVEVCNEVTYEDFVDVGRFPGRSPGARLEAALASGERFLYLQPNTTYRVRNPLVIDRDTPLFIHGLGQTSVIEAFNVAAPGKRHTIFDVRRVPLFEVVHARIGETAVASHLESTAVDLNGPDRKRAHFLGVAVSRHDVRMRSPGFLRWQAGRFMTTGRVRAPLVLDHPDAVAQVVGFSHSNLGYAACQDRVTACTLPAKEPKPGVSKACRGIQQGLCSPRHLPWREEGYHIWVKRGLLSVVFANFVNSWRADVRIETAAWAPHVLSGLRSEGNNGYVSPGDLLLETPETEEPIDVLIAAVNGAWTTGELGWIADYRAAGTLWLMQNDTVQDVDAVAKGDAAGATVYYLANATHANTTRKRSEMTQLRAGRAYQARNTFRNAKRKGAPSYWSKHGFEVLPTDFHAPVIALPEPLKRPPLSRPLKGMVSVAEFGARPDDGRDDTVALNAALNSDCGRRKSIALFFPPGVYEISDPLAHSNEEAGARCGERGWGNWLAGYGAVIDGSRGLDPGEPAFWTMGACSDFLQGLTFKQRPFVREVTGTVAADGVDTGSELRASGSPGWKKNEHAGKYLLLRPRTAGRYQQGRIASNTADTIVLEQTRRSRNKGKYDAPWHEGRAPQAGDPFEIWSTSAFTVLFNNGKNNCATQKNMFQDLVVEGGYAAVCHGCYRYHRGNDSENMLIDVTLRKANLGLGSGWSNAVNNWMYGGRLEGNRIGWGQTALEANAQGPVAGVARVVDSSTVAAMAPGSYASLYLLSRSTAPRIIDRWLGVATYGILPLLAHSEFSPSDETALLFASPANGPLFYYAKVNGEAPGEGHPGRIRIDLRSAASVDHVLSLFSTIDDLDDSKLTGTRAQVDQFPDLPSSPPPGR